MKIYFAEVKDAGQIGAIHGVDLPSADSPTPDGYSHLQRLDGWAGYPERPNAWSVLRWVGGAIAWTDPRSLAQVRADKWESIKAIRNALMDAPITVGAITVDGDGASRFNVIGAVLDMQLTGETTRGWICADNVRRVLTAAQLQQIGIAMAARTQALVDTGDALRTQINDPAKTTAAEVEAVAWPT